MNELQLLKERIYQEGKIETILSELECTNIRREQNGNLIVAQLPARFGSNNKRSVQIRNNESLTAYIRSRDISGDIYSVVGYILYEVTTFEELREYLYQIRVYLCNILDYNHVTIIDNPDFEETIPQNQWNQWLRDIKNKRQARQNQMNTMHKNRILPENILDEYIKLPHIMFWKDGISIKTQREFEVGFDLRTQRIVFPVRNRHGQLIGVKGRYAGPNKEIEEDYKYIYLYPCDKSIELFNLHKAEPYIKQNGEVIVVEGAKSVMLLWQWGIRNAVSIEGSGLSPVQARMLKDLDVDIVFAWDKDISVDFIKRQVNQIKSRAVYALYDTIDIFSDKDSPVDKGFETWNELYTKCKYRVN